MPASYAFSAYAIKYSLRMGGFLNIKMVTNVVGVKDKNL